jgi:hypothetical protein
MPADSFTYALDRLDPASRALLDLSLRRGMRTEEIADVLGAEPENVEASRDEALQRIASDVGVIELDEVRARLAELPQEEWVAGPPTNGNHVAEEPRPRHSIWPLLLGLLVTAGVVVVIALATSGSDDNGGSGNSTPRAQQAPAQPQAGGATQLTAVGAAKATGSAAVNGKTLRLQAKGLPAGHYEVWLYNSILDARSIANADGSRFTETADLPAGWKRFRYVDVSREPRDGNLSHSGESVLRVPTKSLR